MLFFFTVNEAYPSNIDRYQGFYFLSLEVLNSYQIALFMYSHYRGNLPLAFTNYFSRNDTIHMYTDTSSSTKFPYLFD